MPETRLHIARPPAAITLHDALAALAGEPLHHLLGYAPGRWLCRLRFSPAELAPGHDLYEARVFGPAGELRWLRATAPAEAAQGLGQAVFLSPKALTPPKWLSRTLPCTSRISGTYLMADERTLGFDEYLAPAPGQAGEDGNLAIVEQLLHTLAPSSATGHQP